MKCCLNSCQSSEYLNKADELKVSYKDRHKIIDFIEHYPNKTIILDMRGYDGLIAWDDIKRYKIMTKDNFVIALNNLEDISFCKKENIKFYWNFPVSTFYDLKALKDLGVEYVLIESPLFHNIKEAASIGVKLRIVPNIAYYAFIPRDNGVCGSWIRPEDLYMYEPYIEAIEFEDCDLKKEQALYRIYCE